MTPLKLLYVILGSLSLIVGVTGVFVPGLPTTPFLLITAWLFLKGSGSLHKMLLKNRLIGSYINEYHSRKGMTVKQKVSSIGVMWFMIIFSVLFFISSPVTKIIVLAVGITGTVVMGFIAPDADIDKKDES